MPSYRLPGVPDPPYVAEHYALRQTSTPESNNGFGQEHSLLPDGRLDTLVRKLMLWYTTARVPWVVPFYSARRRWRVVRSLSH